MGRFNDGCCRVVTYEVKSNLICSSLKACYRAHLSRFANVEFKPKLTNKKTAQAFANALSRAKTEAAKKRL